MMIPPNVRITKLAFATIPFVAKHVGPRERRRVNEPYHVINPGRQAPYLFFNHRGEFRRGNSLQVYVTYRWLNAWYLRVIEADGQQVFFRLGEGPRLRAFEFVP